MSMFSGTAQTVPSSQYVSQSTEYPKWLQDAIYNQINSATAIANTPYESYGMPTVADLSPDQIRAYEQIRDRQGAWKTNMDIATTGMANLANAPGQVAASSPYYQQALSMSGLATAQPALQEQANLMGSIDYNAPFSTLQTGQNQYLQPDLASYGLQQAQQAYGRSGGIDISGAANPYLLGAAGMSGLENAQGFMQQQAGLLGGLNYNNPVSNLYSAQNQYLAPDLAAAGLQAGQQAYQQAGQQNITGAADPFLMQQMSALGQLNYNAPTAGMAKSQRQYLNPEAASQLAQQGQQGYEKAASLDVAGAAQPYLQQAAQTSAAGVEQYMNPYQEGVMNAIAKQGARNLSENLLPAVSDAFIRAGQFGGSRMGEFGSRALRDTQEAILNQQAQAIQQGYGQALSASQADLARQAQLASTAGQLTGQQQGALSNIAQGQLSAALGQQQVGLGAAQNLTSAQQQALAQAQQGAAQIGQIGAQRGQLTAQQLSALTNLGQAQTAAGQAQQQTGLTAAQQIANAQQQAISQAQQTASQYGTLAGQVGSMTAQQQQILGNLGQTAGQLAGQQASQYLNLGQALANLGQYQQQLGIQGAQNLSAAQQQAITNRLSAAGQYGQLGGMLGALTADQQKMLAGIGQNIAGATGADLASRNAALTNLATLTQQQQQLGAADAAALEAAGQAQQGNVQQKLTAAQNDFLQRQLYQKQQADWLNTQIRGMAPITPSQTASATTSNTVQYGPSPLSQVAGLYSLGRAFTNP